MSIFARPVKYMGKVSSRYVVRRHFGATVRKALRQEIGFYRKGRCQPYWVQSPYRATIDKLLEKDKTRPRQQWHTGRRILVRLRQVEASWPDLLRDLGQVQAVLLDLDGNR
jgi:hypothetical protein